MGGAVLYGTILGQFITNSDSSTFSTATIQWGDDKRLILIDNRNWNNPVLTTNNNYLYTIRVGNGLLHKYTQSW